MIAYLKKLLILSTLSSFCFMYSCRQADTATSEACYFGGEIINPNSKYVYLCKNNEVIDTIILDKNNRFLKKYDSLTPGMYTFRHEPEYQYIYFDKSDSLMIRLNTNEFDNSLTFCGRGDEKNNFLIELFLKNESVKNASFGVYDKDFKTFSKEIDKSYNTNKAFYLRRQTEVNWSEDFDLYAKNMLDMDYLAKKELYPMVHKRRTNEDACMNLPKNYYSYRKSIDFNNEKLMTYSPFLKYLTSMLNNITQDCKHEHLDALENNIKKLKVADSIFKNKKIKNAILNNIAFMYLLEDQNALNNQAFLNQYLKLSSDSEKQKEIKKIGMATQLLAPEKKLQTVDLIDATGRIRMLDDIFTHKSVVFFWSSDAKSHTEMAHKRAMELKEKHPDWNFVSINIDDSTEKWKEMLAQYNFKNIVELHATNFNDIKEKWVITKIHRCLLIEPKGKIKNGFVSLFDANFENNLK